MTFWLQDGTALMLGLFVFVIGLCVGSFINVVVHRLPLMMQREWEQESRALLGIEEQAAPPAQPQEALSLSAPASRCPQCHTPIRWRDNIPVLSFLRLRGRCRDCGTSISWRYPVVELIAGLLALLVMMRWGFAQPPLTIAYIGLAWLLLTMALIDFDTQLLPDVLTYLALWGGLLFHAIWLPSDLPMAVFAAAGGYVFFWLVYQLFLRLTGREGMGYGDFKLLAALGAWFGATALVPIILISSLCGIVYALLTRRPAAQSQPFAFGPFLALAGMVCLLVGAERLNGLFLAP